MNDLTSPKPSHADAWPELPLADWKDSRATVHLWTQIVGKIRLRQTPWINHAWHVVLYLTARGLTTSPIPYGERSLQIDFDFIAHRLYIRSSDGRVQSMALQPRSVADFYQELFLHLEQLGFAIHIYKKPNEIPDPIPFDQDLTHAAYDGDAVHRFWRVLVQADRILQKFRAGFIGKCSPVQFFWGSFDLAVTRFSGRPAPPHPGGIPNLPDRLTREAYSHEVSSAGFWPGGDLNGSGPVPYAAFYSYAYPEPPGFSRAAVRPAAAFYQSDLHEFILPYDAVRRADDPDAYLLEFLQTTYEAAADLGHWDRAALERRVPVPA